MAEPQNNVSLGDASMLVRLQAWQERKSFVAFRENKHGTQLKDIELLRAYILSDACVDDLRRLHDGCFVFPIPRQTMLRKTHSDRRRIIYAFPEPFNTLMKYLVWGLHDYDWLFSPSLYSFRQGRNTSSLFEQITARGLGTRFWAMKADIHDYGHSLVPSHLIAVLSEHVLPRDPELFRFFEALLTFDTYTRDGELIHASMGGLPGIPIGAFFNNVYLKGLDDLMVGQTALYARYADDICAFACSESEAAAALDLVRTETNRLGLSLNESKSQLIAPGNDIELLGFCIRGNELDVADNTLAKARTKLGHFADKLVLKEQRTGLPKDEAAAIMTRKLNRYFYGVENEHELSWRDYFFRTITRPDSLHGLDLYCQDLLRIVATGKRGDARYRFRYADMRKLGYRPLVADYWHSRKRLEKRKNRHLSQIGTLGTEASVPLEPHLPPRALDASRAAQRSHPRR